MPNDLPFVSQGCLVDHGTSRFCTVAKGHIVSVLPTDGAAPLVAAIPVPVISEDLIHENAQLRKAADDARAKAAEKAAADQVHIARLEAQLLAQGGPANSRAVSVEPNIADDTEPDSEEENDCEDDTASEGSAADDDMDDEGDLTLTQAEEEILERAIAAIANIGKSKFHFDVSFQMRCNSTRASTPPTPTHTAPIPFLHIRSSSPPYSSHYYADFEVTLLGQSIMRARGKRRAFSPGAAARHRGRTRVPTDCRQSLFPPLSPFLPIHPPFSIVLEIGRLLVWRSDFNV